MFLWGILLWVKHWREDAATVNSKNMQDKRVKAFGESTNCHMLKSDLSKLVKYQCGKLAWAIHCYSFVPHNTYSTESNILLTEKWSQSAPLGQWTIKIGGRYTGDNTVEANNKSSMVLVSTYQMSTLSSDHRKTNHQTANARITRKDIMKGIRGDGKVLE